MTAYTNRLTSARPVRYLLVLIVLILAIGLVLTNYLAAAALVLGALVYGVVYFVVTRLKAWAGRSRIRWLAMLGALGVILLVLCSVSGLLLLLPLGENTSALPRSLKGYTVIIEPASPAMQDFKVDEKLVVHQIVDSSDTTITLPEYTVSSTGVGFLLREVSITTAKPGPGGLATIRLPDGTVLEVSVDEQASGIELKNWPRDSFYAARNSEDNPKITNDFGTQRIDWSMHDLSQGVAFRYIPPPFQLLRPLLAPFIGASTLSEWMLALVGFLGSVVVGPIVPSVLYDIGKSRLKARLEEAFRKRTSGTEKPQD